MPIPQSEEMLLDFDGWLGKQDEPTRAGISEHLNGLPEATRPTEKQRLGSMFAISEQTGVDLDTVNTRWDTVRGGYAEKKGGDWGAVKDDEPQFFGRMVAQATQQRDERHLVSGPDDQGAFGADVTWQNSLAYQAQEAAYSGKSYTDALAAWQEKNAAKPGYDAARASVYAEAARETHAQVTESLAKVRPVALLAFEQMAQARGVTEGDGNAAPFELFRGMTPAEKELAFRLMSDKAGSGPDKSRTQAFLEATGRGFENLAIGGGSAAYRSKLLGAHFAEGDVVTGRNAADEVQRDFLAQTGARMSSGSGGAGYARAQEKQGGRALTAAEAKDWNAQLDTTREDLDTAEQLRKFGQEMVDPTNKTGGAFFRHVVLPAADSAALMTAMSLPGAWAPALELGARSYQGEEYARLRGQGMDARQADRIALVTGAAQSALDKVEFGLLKGLPGTQRVLSQFAMRGGVAARFLVNTGLTTGAETLVELTQDHIVPALVQDNLAADPRFDVHWGDVWRETAAAAPETALGMILLSGAGGAFQTYGQTRATNELAGSAASMRLKGYSLEQIAEIQAAPKAEQGDLLATYLPVTAPTGTEQTALVAEVAALAKQEQEAFAARQSAETTATAEAADYAVRVTRNGDGWQVVKPDGKVVTVDTAEAARRIREDLRQAGTQEEAAALVAIVDAWHSKAPDGTARETNLTGETVRSDGQTITHSKDGEIVKEVTNAKQLDTLREQARMSAKAAGDEEIDVIVNGQNAVEFRERVSDGARETLQRLTLNQSESTALTAIHEQVEAVWRTGIAKGAITLQETQQAIAGVAAALDPENSHDAEDRAFRARVQRVAAGAASEAETRETVSELAVAEVVGRRKDGKTMPAGSVSAALDAAINNATKPDEVKALGKFRAMLRAVRQYMRGVFGVVAAVNKGKRDGKVTGDYHAFIDKVLGMDEQTAHDKAVIEQVGGQTDGLLDDNEPFSLSHSTPERNARTVRAVEIPAAVLSGGQSDWRRAVRDFIAANLQGLSLKNQDTGWEIGFNSESRSEAVSKLRKEPQFRAAMQVVPIVERAVLIGDSAPGKGRERDTERFHYFAVPVAIEGRSAVAWFNTRKPLQSPHATQAGTFYEFGLYSKAARTSPGLDTDLQPDTPTFGPEETIGSFLEKIKGVLPAAIKVEGQPTFSVSAGSRIELVMKRLDTALAKDPEHRRELERAAQVRLQALQFSWETVRWTPAGDEIKPLVEQRNAASLDAEQAVRQAFRAEELEEQGINTLSNSALSALNHGLQTLDDRPLIAHMLGSHGRLMSKSAAAEAGKFGEYDGVPWLPPKWYSKNGGLMPDEMAQFLYDDGMLSAPTPDALWAALGREVQSVRAGNEAFKEASKAAKEVEKEARNKAKEEAFEWRREQDEQQKKDWSPRARLVRDMRTLDAIVSVFPAEVRARVGGFIKLAQLGSDKARIAEIGRRITRLSGLLENHLQQEARERIEELFDRGRPEMKSGEKPKGSMTPDAQALVRMAERFAQIPAEDMDGERAKVEAALLQPDADLSALAERLQVLELFGGMDEANAVALDAAANWLENMIVTGKNEWRMIQEARIEKWKVDASTLKTDTGKDGDIAALQRDIAKEKTMKRETGGWGFGLISFEQTVNSIYGPKSEIGQALIEKVRAATYQRTDAIRHKREAWNQAMRGIFKKPWHATLLSLWEHAQVNGKLSITAGRLAGRVSRVEQIPLEIAERVIGGSEEMRRTLGFNPEEVDLLEIAVAENAAKGRPLINVPLERFTAGTPTATPMSQLQAVGLLMMSRQQDQAANLDFHGWTAGVLADIDSKLTNEARGIMRWLTEQYKNEYGPINGVFQRMFGAPLPQIQNYSPLAFESLSPGKEMTPDGAGAMGLGGLSPGSLKTRRKHRAAPRLTDALAAYWSHTGQMEHFKAFAEVTREARSVMLRPEVRSSVQEKAGVDGLAALKDWVSVFENDGVQSSASLTRLDRLNTRLQSAVATTALAWNVGTMVKQSLAVLNPAYEMPATSYLRGFTKLLGGRLDFRQILGSEMIRRRVEAGASPELRQVMAGLAGAHPGVKTRLVRQFIQKGMDLLGDADGFFTACGAAIHYDWAKREAMAAGMDDVEASAAAMRRTQGMIDRTSQPVESMNRSLYEAKNATNPSARWLFMFASEARQKAAIYVEALAHVLTGKATAKDKTVLAISHVIVPLVMQTMVNILRDARDDDDDELFDSKHWSLKDYLKAMAIGPLSGFPLIGGIADSLVSLALGRPSMQSNPTNPLNGVSQIVPAIEKMMSEKEAEPIEKGVGVAVSALNVAAIASAFHPDAAAVQWVGSAANAIKQAFQWGDNFVPDSKTEADKKEKRTRARELKEARE